jgi:hypothetical protein
MSRHVEAERLSAYRDGDLSERDAAVVRAHLETCAACTAVSAALGAQVQAMRAFERAEPPPTLWSGIEGALERSERRWSWPSLLAGALAGAAVVAVAAWGIAGKQMGVGAMGQAQDRGGVTATGRGGADVLGAAALVRDPLLLEAERELDRAAASYEQAVARLRKIVEREQERWDPETRTRVGDRLARLDEAVAHSRAVARRDPSDAGGADMLFSAYRRQIDFLAEVVHRGSPADGEGLR